MQGEALVIPKAICLHEEDAGMLWKHTDTRLGHVEVRRNRRLVISQVMITGTWDAQLLGTMAMSCGSSSPTIGDVEVFSILAEACLLGHHPSHPAFILPLAHVRLSRKSLFTSCSSTIMWLVYQEMRKNSNSYSTSISPAICCCEFYAI